MFFTKKRRKKSYNDSSPVVSIETYAPNQSITAQDYIISSEFIAFEESFEAFCRSAFEKIHADPYCRQFMDQYITDMGSVALSDIQFQRANHQSAIDTLAANVDGDLIKAKSKLEDNLKDQEIV